MIQRYVKGVKYAHSKVAIVGRAAVVTFSPCNTSIRQIPIFPKDVDKIQDISYTIYNISERNHSHGQRY